MTDEVVAHGWHWSFGWLRRPELDTKDAYCYEEPDGNLVYSSRAEHSRSMYLDGRVDAVTGETYVADSVFPRLALSKTGRWTVRR
jgi:hypothetical protein